MKRVLAGLVLMASAAFAGTVSVVGSLDPNDANDVRLITFTLWIGGTVDIQGYGYGGSASAPGGTNAAGAPILPGGFDTYFSLFLGSGGGATFILSNDDGSCPPGEVTLACHDSTILTALGAGTYTLAVSVFDNFSFAENLGTGTLGDGFIGLGNYYDASTDSTRTSAYAVDLSTDGSFVPEPATLALLGSAGVFLVLCRLRRNVSTN